MKDVPAGTARQGPELRQVAALAQRSCGGGGRALVADYRAFWDGSLEALAEYLVEEGE